MMNVYGRAMAETKRQANSKVVRMILPSRTADQKPSDKRQKVACGG
jgi:hypothetical protein